MSKDIFQDVSEDVFSQTVLANMAVAVALLDSKLQVNWANSKMITMLGTPISEAKGKRPGDIIHCINAQSPNEEGLRTGCGKHEQCAHCLLQLYASTSLKGELLEQKEVTVKVQGKQGETQELVWLFSASPIQVAGQQYSVVTLQDITVLHQLRGILPICMYCKKIREDDKRVWERLEAFVEFHSLAQFSHGICPECFKEHFPEDVELLDQTD